jgi:hypothetical protein
MEFDDSTMSSLNAAAASQDYASISPSAYALDSQANYGRPRPAQIWLQPRRHWITADIYLQRPADAPPIAQSESYRQWEEQHQIEEKKFKNFADAATFFRRMGFTVDKEARPNYDRLTSLARLREAAGPAAIERLRQPGRTRLHATWRLTA